MGKILIIENQHLQYNEIKRLLVGKGHDVFPIENDSESGLGYSRFMDLVQIFLNQRYDKSRRDKVFKEIKRYIEDIKPDLLVIDYTLVGQQPDAESGIFLAKCLRENSFNQPVFFLSRLSVNDIRVIKEFSYVKRKTQWMQKGYRNKRNLDKEYIKDELIPAIEEWLKSEAKSQAEPDKSARKERVRQILEVFVSYAHAYGDHCEVFVNDLNSATANKPFELRIWTDKEIEVGKSWYERIIEEIEKCDVAILLVSDRFMASEFIKHEEVARLFKRKASGNTLVLPIYFWPCQFSDWPELSENQLFKPKGAAYGFADKDERDWFAYSDLVDFETKGGVKILKDNPNRSRYMIDFVNKIEGQLTEIAQKKNS